MNELEQSLSERLLLLMAKYDINLSDAQREITMILSNYEIKPKETALVIYTEGKNEMYIKKFLLAKAVAGRTKKTIEQYRAEITRFLENIGKDADTITGNDVQMYFAQKIIDGRTKSYVDTLRRYLNSFFSYLTTEELISKNPIAKIEKIKYHSEKEEAFSDIEIERLRAACKNNREKAILEILLSTGCRASEVANIKIADIVKDHIDIIGKGERLRRVYINAKAEIAIEMYLSERKDKNPFLFPAGLKLNDPSSQSGRRLRSEWYKNSEFVDSSKSATNGSINIVVNRLGKRAGVKNVHAHRFRRTCATMALRRGMPIELVSKMLGHEHLNTTQIYLDLREEDLKNAHEKYVF